MARFRAYTSDSSDEGSSSEPEVQEENVDVEEEGNESDQGSTSSSSSSDMQEEELFTSPSRPYRRPNRNALVEGEDGEIRYAHEVEDGQRVSVRVSPASSSSSPPPARNRGDPTIIPWAQHVGVDAQKMHVMQTSLFRMPEEAAALRAMNQQTKPNLRVPLQPLNRKHSRDSDGDGLRFEPREVSLTTCLTLISTEVTVGTRPVAKSNDWFISSALHLRTTLTHQLIDRRENMPEWRALSRLLTGTKVSWLMRDWLWVGLSVLDGVQGGR